MASDKVLEFTDANFKGEVLQSQTPVLVDFWAEWCMPCRMLAPVIDELADEFDGRVKIGKVDTDTNRNVSMEYGITSIPTVLLFKGGELKKKFAGLTKKNELQAALSEAAGD